MTETRKKQRMLTFLGASPGDKQLSDTQLMYNAYFIIVSELDNGCSKIYCPRSLVDESLSHLSLKHPSLFVGKRGAYIFNRLYRLQRYRQCLWVMDHGARVNVAKTLTRLRLDSVTLHNNENVLWMIRQMESREILSIVEEQFPKLPNELIRRLNAFLKPEQETQLRKCCG